jgi:hypothetical protein
MRPWVGSLLVAFGAGYLFGLGSPWAGPVALLALALRIWEEGHRD